jgi:hypothetical protein
MARGRNWKWFDYYWSFCKELGAETYKTWRWELFASIPIGFFIAFINGNWKDFRTALLATGMTLGCFVVWHALRVPWLLHRSTHTLDSDRGTLAGVFGIAVIAALLIGGMEFGRALWSARPPFNSTSQLDELVHSKIKQQRISDSLRRSGVTGWVLIAYVGNTQPESADVFMHQFAKGGWKTSPTPVPLPVGISSIRTRESLYLLARDCTGQQTRAVIEALKAADIDTPFRTEEPGIRLSPMGGPDVTIVINSH